MRLLYMRHMCILIVHSLCIYMLRSDESGTQQILQSAMQERKALHRVGALRREWLRACKKSRSCGLHTKECSLDDAHYVWRGSRMHEEFLRAQRMRDAQTACSTRCGGALAVSKMLCAAQEDTESDVCSRGHVRVDKTCDANNSSIARASALMMAGSHAE